MANRYANLVGSNKIKDEWQKINDGFDKVEQDVDQLRADLDQEIADRAAAVEYVDQRVDNIIVGGGPDKDPELVDIRNLDPSYTPQREINVAGDVTRDMQAQFAAHKADTLTRAINVKYPPAPLVGAVGDGVADDTEVIQDILDYLGGLGGGELFFPQGEYLITDKVIVPDNLTLRGNLTATFIYQGVDDLDGTVGFRPKNNVTFRGLKFINTTNGTSERRRAILLDPTAVGSATGLKNLVVEDCEFEGFFYSIDARTETSLRNSNVYVNRCKIKAPTYGNAGAILIRETLGVMVTNCIVDGGTTAAAIGVTAGSSDITIDNNEVTNNKEASIQVEDSLGNKGIVITSNLCDGAIWIDDCSEVIVSQNISDTIYVTVTTERSEDVQIIDNITGKIYAQAYGTAGPNAEIDNLTLRGNDLVGAVGYWDNVLQNNTHGIFTASVVRKARIEQNNARPDTFTNDITVSTSNALTDLLVRFNRFQTFNISGALVGRLIEYGNGVVPTGTTNTNSPHLSRLLEPNPFYLDLPGQYALRSERTVEIAPSGSNQARFTIPSIPSGEARVMSLTVFIKDITTPAYHSWKQDLIIRNTEGKLTVTTSGKYAEVVPTSEITVTYTAPSSTSVNANVSNGSSKTIFVHFFGIVSGIASANRE